MDRLAETSTRSRAPTRGRSQALAADILGALCRRAIRTLAAGAVVAGVAAPLLRHRLKLPRPVVSALAWQAPYALTVALPRTRLRDAGVYGAPDARVRRSLRDAERRPRGAAAPAQGRLPDQGRPRARRAASPRRCGCSAASAAARAWCAATTSGSRGSTGAGSSSRTRRSRTCSGGWPERFPRAAGQLAATFDLGCVVYWAVPTAPPWWAGKNGNLEPVRRIMVDAGEHYWGRLWRPLYDSLAGNPLAAMPSLHFGTSVMAAHVLSDVGRGHGAVGWAYTGALGFRARLPG